MKYLIYGEDAISRRNELTEIVGAFLKKGFEEKVITDASFDEVDFLNEILSDDLFGQKKVLVMSHCLSTPDIKNFLEEKKEEIQQTETPIVFVESKFLKKDFPSFKKIFEKVSEHKLVVKKEKARFNVFPLIDAIVSGDKKKSWILFQEARKENVATEEILNLLFWQYKTLSLVATGESAAALKMKPFVYSKSQRLVSKFSQEDLRRKMFEVINLFQVSRMEKDSEERLEKLILS
jgi:DNA polymerase III delta subunit